ncbi:MAG: hypothetical protein MJ067_00380, partial [Oscillospiraceae bacterium]|nr:hypothetical protein [Oscillospiraceae bacterium]
MKRKILAVLLCAVLVLTFVPAMAFAEDEEIDWTASEISISTADQLVEFAKKVNEENKNFRGQTVKLAADIDLAGIVWTPVGDVNGYPGKSFSGTFDGDGHTISNLTASDSRPDYATAGLFGSLLGTIKNVTLENVTVTSTHYAGAICGYSSANASTITNCHVKGGTITSEPEKIGNGYDNGDKVGGIIGYIVNGDKVTDCSVEDVTVNGYRDIGGIVGCATGGAAAGVKNCTVKNSSIIGGTMEDELNYKKYTEKSQYNVGAVVGRADGLDDSNAESDNTVRVRPYELADGEIYWGASEILISNADELLEFAKKVNEENKNFRGQTVKLAEDIDLDGIAWTPVGDVSSYPGKSFSGTFDGDGHTISNLTASDSTSNYATAGFFGSLLGTIKNVTLENVTVSSTHYAGAICGFSSTNGCTITNCHVKGGTITSVPELLGDEYDNG